VLHTEIVDATTLELIKRLQSKDYLNGFYLVGGTALALQMGHRKSVDIDLFSNFGFDTMHLLENLSHDFDFKLFYSAGNTLKGAIDGVQVDIIAHRYPYVAEPLEKEGVSMLSLQDIAAMKLNAIAVSGQRVKDFIDIYYLLQQFTLAEMIGFYKKKYKQFNEVTVLKSIIWYDDVDLSEWPVMQDKPKLQWKEITETIKLVPVWKWLLQ